MRSISLHPVIHFRKGNLDDWSVGWSSKFKDKTLTLTFGSKILSLPARHIFWSASSVSMSRDVMLAMKVSNESIFDMAADYSLL